MPVKRNMNKHQIFSFLSQKNLQTLEVLSKLDITNTEQLVYNIIYRGNS